jgi:hypothetical protein
MTRGVGRLCVFRPRRRLGRIRRRSAGRFPRNRTRTRRQISGFRLASQAKVLPPRGSDGSTLSLCRDSCTPQASLRFAPQAEVVAGRLPRVSPLGGYPEGHSWAARASFHGWAAISMSGCPQLILKSSLMQELFLFETTLRTQAPAEHPADLDSITRGLDGSTAREKREDRDDHGDD